MVKIKNFLRKIRIEEYVLSLFSLILFLVFFISNLQYSWLESFKISFKNIAMGLKLFPSIFLFLYLYIFFKLYLYLVHYFSPFIEKKKSLKENIFPLKNLFNDIFRRVKSIFVNILIVLRPILFLIIFFSLVSLILGQISIACKDRLIDSQLAQIDKLIFGFYPFFDLSNQEILLGKMSLFFIYSFMALGEMIGVILLIFYFLNKKKIFSRYLIAMTLPIMISLPLWFFFPVNSPQNTYLNNVYQKEIEYSLLSPLENYQPSRHILEFHKKSGVMQGGTAPISTMPSMHVAWAIVIVYYLYQFKKRTIYFTLPWAFFSSLGTVYLAQHFFVDILVAIPIAISAIIITNYLVKIEKKYYQGGIYDNREKIFKEEIKDHFQQIWQKIYSFLPQKR